MFALLIACVLVTLRDETNAVKNWPKSYVWDKFTYVNDTELPPLQSLVVFETSAKVAKFFRSSTPN